VEEKEGDLINRGGNQRKKTRKRLKNRLRSLKNLSKHKDGPDGGKGLVVSWVSSKKVKKEKMGGKRGKSPR